MQAGDFFNERYIVERILGKGGMGTVYLVRNINTDTYWAVKEIDMNADLRINLAAEPNLLKKLNHPALPRLFDIIQQDGYLYMISDFIDGVSLDKKLGEEGSFEEEIVVDWAIQLCGALDYLHSIKPNPIIFRDIKPSNIMLTEKGKLMLIDFGTAREYKPQSEADTVYIGTRGYAAPEQFGTGQTSAVSDIYSLGVTLHHLLTGKSPVEAPFRLRPIRYYNQLLSPELEEIISKCTAEAMAERYQSIPELLQDLLELQEGWYPDKQEYLRGRYPDGQEYYSRSFSDDDGTSDDGPFYEEYEPESEAKDRCQPVGYLGVSRSTAGDYQDDDNGGQVDEVPDIDSMIRKANRYEKPGTARKKVRKEEKRRPDAKKQNNAEGHKGSAYYNDRRHEPVRSFKRLVITVWDNAEFGCELAYTAAKYTGSNVLVADLDLLAPKADIILNTGKYPVKPHESGALGHSGLDMVMDAINRGVLTSALLKQCAIVKNEMKNLYIITGNYKLENYEYYSEESVPQLIDKCYRSFDITILLVNRSIYDAFTLSALLKSDMNIAAVRGDIVSLREFNTYVAFLKDKQRLPPENTRFVLFEYEKSTEMGVSEVRQATQDNLLGCIPYSRKRALYRCLKGAYASHMEKEVLNEYYHIHEKLGLIPAVSLFQKLARLFALKPAGAGAKKDDIKEGRHYARG